MTQAMKVLLAEDHTLVRAGIRSLLAELPWVQVVGEASDGREALRQVAELQPDLVLMDITMAGLNGLDATERIAQDHPSVRVIILSMHASEEYVRRALIVGAAGYVLKDAEKEELELALKSVARGGTYLSPQVSRPVISDYTERTSRHSLERLTARQREILQLIAEGNSTKDIAQNLGLSVKTVETHRAQLMARLDIHDIAGLVRYAIRAGIASSDA
ncbi:MAG: response regulator transcription factor [Gemmatimonadetes bacterium]|nr:response regulator transcription factor [Gemmatimonadota bacterium]